MGKNGVHLYDHMYNVNYICIGNLAFQTKACFDMILPYITLLVYNKFFFVFRFSTETSIFLFEKYLLTFCRHVSLYSFYNKYDSNTVVSCEFCAVFAELISSSSCCSSSLAVIASLSSQFTKSARLRANFLFN